MNTEKPEGSVVVMITVAVVIMVVPIALGVPAVLMFVPPAVVGIPAVLTGLAEFDPGALGLAALPAVTGSGLVEFVVGAGDAALAIVVVRLQCGCGNKQQERGQGRGCQESGFESWSVWDSHRYSVLLIGDCVFRDCFELQHSARLDGKIVQCHFQFGHGRAQFLDVLQFWIGGLSESVARWRYG